LARHHFEKGRILKCEVPGKGCLLNASWPATAPPGRPTLIAQRGLHQTYTSEGIDDQTCTAQHILPPAHSMIDNALPSIAAAFFFGADVVEIDVRQTKDDQFVLFHDYSLDCRTDAVGPVAEQARRPQRQ